ncbi:IclR family transcriptional regulator [Kribbella sancticallisti]|uniref:IclR family transcriptional regulator n=1 Tax=Kribbella sancticallisti TaxID=460087 RepID=UPI0031CF59B5
MPKPGFHTARPVGREPGEPGPVEQPDRDYTVRAVDRVCAVLNLLQDSIEGVSLATVAEAAELPKSSAFRYLWTLETHRYVERDGVSGLYRLGLGFAGMQSRHLELLRHRARPVLEALRDELGETINLGILDGSSIIYLDLVESKRGVRMAAKGGDRDPIHSTALGKAIAAFLTEAEVLAALEHSGMPAVTPQTITTVPGYLKELAKVRRLGYAVDDAENEVDGRCVAVPIQGTLLPAALSVSAPASRLPVQDIERVASRLREAATEIARYRD